MKPSKKFQEYLGVTSNWRFRQRLANLSSEIDDISALLESRLIQRNYEEVDYIIRKLHAAAKLLDKIATKKRKELCGP